LAPRWKLQWVAVEQVDHQAAEHPVARTEKVRHNSQVDKAVTPAHSHTQVQVAVAEEPLHYSLTARQ
jgi:hypothetical protein